MEHLLKRNKFLALILSLSAILNTTATLAQVSEPTTSGRAEIYRNGNLTQIVIEGDAAAILYKDLKSRDGVTEDVCAGKRSVTVSPFRCIQSEGHGTLCISLLLEGNSAFTVPDICDAPFPSIIGVGSTPGVTQNNDK